jgi:NADPH:quinone reductase-like Zn-dependent oxidoreductase
MHAVDEMNATVRLAPAEAVGHTMRAIVHPRYGAPDVLGFEEVERPVPGDDDVLVRVHAAGASVGDHHVVSGTPYLIRLSPFGGLPRPRNRVPGTALAGRVEAVGAKVTTFRPGDEVFGQAGSGAFAEYVVVPARLIAPKPSNLSFEEAAAVPWAVTALQGLRDAGGLKAGQRVLINGASGGVGTWAVQIAKALGASVTAVCSTHNVEMVRALGADEVVDYTKEDFVAGGARFDLMLDTVGNRSLSECRSVLVKRGTYVACSGGGGDWFGPLFRLVGMLVVSLFTSQKLTTFVASPSQEDLLALKELVEAGKAKPVIERRYLLSEVADALRHVGEGHAHGQTVILIAGLPRRAGAGGHATSSGPSEKPSTRRSSARGNGGRSAVPAKVPAKRRATCPVRV